VIRDAADNRVQRIDGGDDALKKFERNTNIQDENKADEQHRNLCQECFTMVQRELDLIQMSVKINKYKQ
jgi:hypothetical protein